MGRGTLLIGSIAVAAIAFAAAPASATTPTEWDFGQVKVGGTSAPKVFTFGPFDIALPTEEGLATEGPFRVTAEDCPPVLAMGATCTGTVVFEPTTFGTISGNVKTQASGPGGYAALKGVGGILSSGGKGKKCNKKGKKGAAAAKKKKCKKKK